MALPPAKVFRVLCAEPQNYSERALKTVAAFAELDAAVLPQGEFVRQAINYDALMVRLQLRVTDDIIASAPHLKAILSPTTGLDHIDLQAARSHDVAVFSLQGETDFLREVYSSAEHSFALLLSLIRNIPVAVEAVKRNRWQQNPYRGHELNGKTLGIVGCGRIGTKVARYGHVFGMRVLAYDPYVEQFPKHVHPANSLDALLKESDILSIHGPLNETTERMIGVRELSLLPKGAFLINTSRGAVLDEDALIDSLDQGHLAGAALDVLINEHLIAVKGHPLIEYAKAHSNLLITPHIGGAAWEAIEKTDMFIIRKFRKWMASQGLEKNT